MADEEKQPALFEKGEWYDLTFRWRGRYNEDTDLSIRLMKAGYATVLFNVFLAFKETTMTMKGGNAETLYKGDGRLKMAQSLCEQHPDIATITLKWGRWQHQVDYSQFKRIPLIFKPGVEIPDGVNNYGMVLQIDDPKSPSEISVETPRSAPVANQVGQYGFAVDNGTTAYHYAGDEVEND